MSESVSARHIRASLVGLLAEAEFLPELEALWAEEDDVNRDVWHVEWWNLLGGLALLDQEFRAGTLTPDQQERYTHLRQTLRHHLDILKRLELPLPTVPLE